MSAVVILVLCETVRFLVKDKSENTFIKYVYQEHNALGTTNLAKISQMTTLFGALLRDNTKIASRENAKDETTKPF